MKGQGWATLVVLAMGISGAVGCSTESFCFSDCETGGAGTGGGTGGLGGTAGGGTGGIVVGGSGGTGSINPFGGSAGTDSGSCVANPPEICNGADDDCDGKIDNLPVEEWSKPEHCGNCDTNCTTLSHTVEQTCEPPASPDGTTAGTCKYKCEVDFYDLDPTKEGCEYQCPWNPNGTNTTDTGGEFGCQKDDDCDGQVDEDLDTCSDVNNCGTCGKKCALPHATVKCTTTAASGTPCTSANTGCEIATCDTGWWDADNADSNGCEYACTLTAGGKEICDGLDNDCDGLIDNADSSLETDDPDVADACFGGTQGECAKTTHQGLKKCIGGAIKCCDPDSNNLDNTNPNFPKNGIRNQLCDATTGVQVLKPGDAPEKCNNLDDDCDGQIDNNPDDQGGKCGNNVGNCIQGTEQCQNGALVCIGKIDPVPETCNGQDDNCDGVIDGAVPTGTAVTCTTNANCTATQFCAQVGSVKQCVDTPTDAIGDCAPPGFQLPVPPPCQKGALACVGGVKSCVGYVAPQGSTDACGVDTNCDGALTNQPDLQNDVNNCGVCGKKCGTAGDHVNWECKLGLCSPKLPPNKCENGFIDCDSNANDCEKACQFVSPTEQCNGNDDDCNCAVDDNIPAAQKPSPVQVCSVAPSASDTGCTTGVSIACAGSAGWTCTFPPGYCSGTKPNYCSGTADTCDDKDNNCNGTVDEKYTQAAGWANYKTKPCSTPASDGACQGAGSYVCNTTKDDTVCNAVKDMTKATAEFCDDLDNDCDGVADEAYNAKGTNPTYWVKPAVTQIGPSLWMSQYEISRPDATTTTPGFKVRGCSVPGKVPWFNSTGAEAAQVCAERGGRLCRTTEWQTACRTPTNTCKWGYNPRTGSPTPPCALPTDYLTTGTRVCNLGYFDFEPAAPGNQDGLLPTASASLNNCWADWSGTTGNTTATDKLYDITGNLREITLNNLTPPGQPSGCDWTNPSTWQGNSTCLYTLMGGAFSADAEDGAQCNFTFYTVNAQYKLFDVGFRCCFDTNPS